MPAASAASSKGIFEVPSDQIPANQTESLNPYYISIFIIGKD